MNKTAERIVARSDGLTCSGSRIRARQPLADAKLRLAIRSVCAVEKPSADRSDEIATTFALSRRGDSRTYQIRVERFFGGPSGILGGAAILFIGDPEKAPRIPDRTLTELYGLTAAEARLSNLLLQGSDLSEACGLLRISRNTGRAHLRNIFDKLGVRSQGQLVAMLSRGLACFSSATDRAPV